MMLAILNWVLLAFLAVSNAALIRIMLSRTGRCSYKNCMPELRQPRSANAECLPPHLRLPRNTILESGTYR